MSISPAYPLPNATGESAQETARLEHLHYTWLIELGSLSLRPFPAHMKTALDIGCGTGIWARTMATQYPNTDFVGIDVNPPIQGLLETASNKNCRFVKANVEEDWIFVDEPSTVDYVLSRLLSPAIQDWQGLYNRAYAVIRPGGYFESQETRVGISSDDDKKFQDAPLMKWFSHLREFVSYGGGDPDSIDTHGERLEAAGFEIIEEKPIRWWVDPTRPEMKGKEEISQRVMNQLLNFVDLVTPRVFARSTVMSLEEGLQLAAAAKRDLEDNHAKAGYHTRFHARLAQKPLSS